MSKKIFIGFISLAILLILIGSFYDLSISQNLYNEQNSFAIFLASYGESPALLINWLGFLILSKEQKTKKQTIWMYLLLIAPAYIFVETYIYYKEYLFIGVLFQIVICLLPAYFISKWIDRFDASWRKRVGWLCLILPNLEILTCLVIKLAVARPRYRSVVAFEQFSFVEWFKINYSYRKIGLSSKLVDINEFFSLPSGHTANAACLFALAGLFDYKMEKKSRALMILVAFAFTTLVGYTRIVMGAHYLSDVAIGFIVGVAEYFYLYKKLNIICKNLHMN